VRNDLVSDLGEDSYATCLYAVFGPSGAPARIAGRAPPPVAVHPHGTGHSPHVAPDPPFEAHQLPLPDASLLVLCTDGLVESATWDADQGLAQLRQTLAQATAETACFEAADEDDRIRRLEQLCDAVVSALLPDDHERTTDDAGLVIVHARCTAAQHVGSLDLHDDPRTVSKARR
jgi:hypothetical protein